MRCHYCEYNTRIVKTREISGGYSITRTRECDGPKAHRFNTKETGPPGHDLASVVVRQSGSGQLGEALFDVDRLFRDISNGVLDRLTEVQIGEVTGDVVAALERAGGFATTFSERERSAFPDAAGWIWDHQIAEEVELQIQRRNELAVIVYALSTRGRQNRTGRNGWQNAGEVIAWVRDRHPTLDLAATTYLQHTEEQVWRHPGARSPVPTMLVKRSRAEAIRGTQIRFDRQRFLRSIRLAVVGRFEETKRELKVDQIAEWVLWGLAGHDIVLSSQLAIGVLDCLRRMDDIAYLRWAAHVKGFESVAEFAAEANGLLEYPSPRLVLRGTIQRGREAAVPPGPVR